MVSTKWRPVVSQESKAKTITFLGFIFWIIIFYSLNSVPINLYLLNAFYKPKHQICRYCVSLLVHRIFDRLGALSKCLYHFFGYHSYQRQLLKTGTHYHHRHDIDHGQWDLKWAELIQLEMNLNLRRKEVRKRRWYCANESRLTPPGVITNNYWERPHLTRSNRLRYHIALRRLNSSSRPSLGLSLLVGQAPLHISQPFRLLPSWPNSIELLASPPMCFPFV